MQAAEAARRAQVSLKRVRHYTLADAHAARIEQRIASLQVMHAALRTLAEGCRGGERDECPIPNLEGGIAHEQQQIRVRKDGEPRI